MAYQLDFGPVLAQADRFAEGALMTLELSFAAIACGTLIGTAGAIAASFGNVHGLAKAGEVKLKPEILADLLPEARSDAHFKGFVFHGGSGSSQAEIRLAVANGVVKMNLDTECQLEYSRPVFEHVLKTHAEVLNADVPNKKHFDPRSWGAKAVDSMAARVAQACRDMGSAGKAEEQTRAA